MLFLVFCQQMSKHFDLNIYLMSSHINSLLNPEIVPQIFHFYRIQLSISKPTLWNKTSCPWFVFFVVVVL